MGTGTLVRFSPTEFYWRRDAKTVVSEISQQPGQNHQCFMDNSHAWGE
jgi:hypothetical protein